MQNGSAIFAFVAGESGTAPFDIIAAHSDCPASTALRMREGVR